MVLVSVETTSAVTWPIIINATKITAWKIYHSKKNYSTSFFHWQFSHNLRAEVDDDSDYKSISWDEHHAGAEKPAKDVQWEEEGSPVEL